MNMEQRNYLRIWTLDVYIFISIFLIKNQMMLSASALEQADHIYRCASLFVFLFIVQQGGDRSDLQFHQFATKALHVVNAALCPLVAVCRTTENFIY